jgi:hypothetical protein
MTDFRPIIFGRMAAIGIGPAEIARQVAEAWGMTAKSAKEELSKWKAGSVGLQSWRLAILFDVLGLCVVPCTIEMNAVEADAALAETEDVISRELDEIRDHITRIGR